MSSVKNDINSTEKLLNVIRGKDKESFSALGKPATSLSKKNPNTKIIAPKRFFNKKSYTIGVDIGREFILLAKTTKGSDGKPVLVDQKIIPYSSPASKGSSEFSTLLKSSLLAFCGSMATCNIWTNISTSEVNVYYIKVPHVPKKQLENVIYWTAKKEGYLDENKLIFDYELQDDIVDKTNPKYSVMVYTVPKTEIEEIKTLFSDIGINLAGITIAPFAIQNIYRSKWLPITEEIFAHLFIGNDFSRINVYRKDNLVSTRGIKAGNGSMTEAIIESVLEKTGKLKLKNDEARKILLSLSPDSERLKDTDAGYNLTREEILGMISPVWERLARQIDITLKHYTSSIGYKKVEKIYILSSSSVYDAILDYMSDQLETKVEFFDPFKQQTVLSFADSISISEKVFLSPSLGLALSDNRRTPNAIFTYSEKNKEINTKRTDRLIFLSFVIALIICLVTLIYQGSKVSILNKERTKLEKELALYNPLLSTDKISKMVDEEKMQKAITRQYAQRYLGLAIIGEVADLTPADIRLISFKITQGTASPKAVADKVTKEASDGIVLEGVVSGEKNMLDAILAQYVMKLENSPMLSQISIQKNSIIIFKKSDVLHFSLNAKIGKS